MRDSYVTNPRGNPSHRLFILHLMSYVMTSLIFHICCCIGMFTYVRMLHGWHLISGDQARESEGESLSVCVTFVTFSASAFQDSVKLNASAAMSRSHYRNSTNITHSLVPNTAQLSSNELNIDDNLLHRHKSLDHCDPQETLLEHCLQAILSHSTVEEQCAVLLSAPTLPLFSRWFL